jgi:small subunit ribosomal protein S6
MKYETIMIFNVQQNEEGITALADKFKALIAENGTIDAVEEWGKRRLAYPIEDEIEGYYLLVRFTSHPSFPAELDRVYKITDGVLRTLIVVNEQEEKPAPAKAEPVKAEPVASEPESVEENA